MLANPNSLMNRSKSLAEKKSAKATGSAPVQKIAVKQSMNGSKAVLPIRKKKDDNFAFMPDHRNDLDDYLAEQEAKEEAARKEREERAAKIAAAK